MNVKGWRPAALLLIGLGALGCSETEDCVVTCDVDADCPGGKQCGSTGRCTSGAVCPCEAGESLACVDSSTALVCNATGNGGEHATCGAPGCNADAERCNTCIPNELSCSPDHLTLEHCGGDGLLAASDACAVGCVDAADGVAAHCAFLDPKWLPGGCDEVATMPARAIDADTMIDTTDSGQCDAVITQSSGPEICVIRAGTITIASKLTVRGARSLALVADTRLELTTTGVLDAAARGQTSGPGGGTAPTGEGPAGGAGGGGAGFRTAGAAGGASTQGGGSVGGVVISPTSLTGGTRAKGNNGGGGGGAVALIACRGIVEVSGLVAAGGGGGAGGSGPDTISGLPPIGGFGGGAGGYLVFQGLEVTITGKTYVNGGGGGGGCTTMNIEGAPGGDGLPVPTSAEGGPPTGNNAGGGGRGGVAASAPTDGLPGSSSAGGGGGATGRLQVYTPEGVTPTVAPSEGMPQYDPDATAPTK